MQSKPKNLSPEQLLDLLKKDIEKPLLVDVRESEELKIAPFPYQVVHMPLSTASLWMTNLSDYLSNNKTIVVICHAGVRSWNFGMWLIEQNWDSEIWNLEGGIDSWSVRIDSSVPRY